MRKVAMWEAKHPKIVVLIALLLLIPALIGFVTTKINYDIMSYLPDDLESVQGEVVLDKTFNNAAMSIVVVKDMPTRFTAALKSEIEQIEGVSTVLWVNEIADISIPAEILPDVLTDVFYSQDGSETMMLVQYENDGASEITLNAIKEMKELTVKNVYISGLSATIENIKAICETEAPIYIAFGVFLALVVMMLMMESWALPFITMATIGMAIVYNMGTNFFTGSISFITQSIAAVMQLGVTMDYSIFLMDRYTEEKRITPDKITAMTNAVTKSFSSLLGSSLTTIFGFLALCFMQLGLGFDIGFVMAKGVLFGILTALFILPAIILLLDDKIVKYKHKTIIPKFDRLNKKVFEKRKVLAVIFIILLVPAYFVQSKAEKYYNMDKALPQDISSIQGLNELKNNFNMACTHFVIVDDTLPDAQIIQMEKKMQDVEGISSVLAYNTLVGPAIPQEIIPDELLSICKADNLQLIMVNSVYPCATDNCNKQVDVLESIAKSYDKNALITGEGAISKGLVDVTQVDFKVTAAISIAAILILIAISFRSVSIPLLLVLSIELAIWLNISVSVLLGKELSFVDPTVINCVQLGATVDYAILLTTRFREEMRNGVDKANAIHNAVAAAEKSILQSASVFFASTFGVYLICDISLIKGICALIARGSVISAIMVSCFLTPILYISEKFISKTTYHWMEGPKKAVAEGVAESENAVYDVEERTDDNAGEESDNEE
ncbi:MAG: MMPL family transporter [Clostridiales bacterium]|nr:MMPL family transporter [Clostridiales bacterium]